MAFSYGPYTFDGQADGDAAAFDWTDQSGTTSALQNSNTAGRWCWEDESTTSSNVGPDHGAGGDPDGYAYTEMSSQAIGDIWYCTFGTTLDASANNIVIDFKWCARGDDAEPVLQVQTSENGGTWTDRGSAMGFGDVTIPGTSGATTWWAEQVDLTGLVSHASTEVRIKITCNGATFWHNDIGLDEIELTGTDTTVTPAITNVEDEDIEVGETGVTITGTGFQTDGANSRVRIDSSSAGTGTSTTQTDTSWADTSIDFTCSLGSLSYGTNYVFVRNHTDEEENATGYSINLYQSLSTTSMGDSTIYDEQTAVVVNGTNLGSSQGSSEVYLCDSSDGSGTNVAQTVTNWTSTAVTFTVDIGALSLGTAYVLVARNQSSQGDTGERFTNAQTVTLIAVPSGPEIEYVGDSQYDNTISEIEESVEIVGSTFESAIGTGNVQICPTVTYSSGTAVTQTIDTWSDTSIEFDVVKGTLSYGTNYLFVLNDSGDRNLVGHEITLTKTPITDGLYQTGSFQGTITSTGITITAFLIPDE